MLRKKGANNRNEGTLNRSLLFTQHHPSTPKQPPFPDRQKPLPSICCARSLSVASLVIMELLSTIKTRCPPAFAFTLRNRFHQRPLLNADFTVLHTALYLICLPLHHVSSLLLLGAAFPNLLYDSPSNLFTPS
jgi:hypothetical protein